MQAYVRGVIEQKLDVLVPISHQPRDLVSEIIADASSRFPEFASCSRKRIRTFLKSYRRSKKIKDVTGTFSVSPATNGVGKVCGVGGRCEGVTVCVCVCVCREKR